MSDLLAAKGERNRTDGVWRDNSDLSHYGSDTTGRREVVQGAEDLQIRLGLQSQCVLAPI
jgi:hypothetical protein